jgi:hypothetical protein
MKEVDPIALFRLALLGPLVSRTKLARGELQSMLRELASKEYDIPGSRRRQVAEKTLQIWFSVEQIVRRSKTRFEVISPIEQRVSLHLIRRCLSSVQHRDQLIGWPETSFAQRWW